MDARQFWKIMREDDDLLLLRCVEGLTPAGDYLDIACLSIGGATRIGVNAILKTDEVDLMELLRFQRPARVMTQVTRTAQDWRFTHTMNGSTRAEVRDRSNGDYGVEELERIAS